MPKKKKTDDPIPSDLTHRVTTFGPNGQSSQEVAPEAKDLDLGPILLPTPDEALVILGTLAELNDRVVQAHARYQAAQEKAKALKAKWEGLADELQTMLRTATHPASLPLLDPLVREADQAAMEAAMFPSRTGQEPRDESEPRLALATAAEGSYDGPEPF